MRVDQQSEALPSVSSAAFKSAMRRIASTVTVITSRAGDVLNGMTATAVCSVSAEPPCVLVVVNRTNRSHDMIRKSGVFAINVLTEEQEALAAHFSLKLDDPFADVDYHAGHTGVPVLAGCAATLECIVDSRTVSGTHSIFVGRVVQAAEIDALPLLHGNGVFSRLESRD